MRKVLLISILVFCLTLLCSCSDEVESVRDNDGGRSMFIEIEETSSWRVVYHRDTKVMYAVSYGSYNCGTFTLLVNADGTPMIYED